MCCEKMKEEVGKATARLTCGKDAGIDEIISMLKYGGDEEI